MKRKISSRDRAHFLNQALNMFVLAVKLSILAVTRFDLLSQSAFQQAFEVLQGFGTPTWASQPNHWRWCLVKLPVKCAIQTQRNTKLPLPKCMHNTSINCTSVTLFFFFFLKLGFCEKYKEKAMRWKSLHNVSNPYFAGVRRWATKD